MSKKIETRFKRKNILQIVVSFFLYPQMAVYFWEIFKDLKDKTV